MLIRNLCKCGIYANEEFMQMGYVHTSNSCISWKSLRCIHCAGAVQKQSKSGRKCARIPIFLSLSHFAKMAHKIAKSKFFPIFKMNPIRC